MGYKLSPVPKGAKLEDLFTHKSNIYRQAARLFFGGHALTTNQLAEVTGMSLSSVWVAVKAFKDAGLIYISKWVKPEDKPTSVLPVYRAGNKVDAARPKPKSPTQNERNKKHRQLVKDKLEHEQDKYNWKGIAEALVPKRTPEQVAEVNRLYLNWVSEGMYG